MLVHSKYGQAHLLCYVLDRIPVNPAQDEGAAALRRQRIEDGLKVTQFVTRMEGVLRRMIRLEHVKFRDQFQRDDFFPPRFIDQQVSRDLEQKRPAALGPVDIATGISPRHAFGDEIIDIVAAGHHPTQPRSQGALIRQYGLLEPV